MGPIEDRLGIEQGGKSSDKLYRLCNNIQLKTAQKSGLGVIMPGHVHIASIGQADDVALCSTSIQSLRNLVQLTESYCNSYHFTLVPDKTKLLAFGPQAFLKPYHDKLTADKKYQRTNSVCN